MALTRKPSQIEASVSCKPKSLPHRIFLRTFLSGFEAVALTTAENGPIPCDDVVSGRSAVTVPLDVTPPAQSGAETNHEAAHVTATAVSRTVSEIRAILRDFIKFLPKQKRFFQLRPAVARKPWQIEASFKSGQKVLPHRIFLSTFLSSFEAVAPTTAENGPISCDKVVSGRSAVTDALALTSRAQKGGQTHYEAHHVGTKVISRAVSEMRSILR